jgi:UDP-N-acetylmuramyl pentapeptide phosphotransferase/UDP-N-acetylglucosamine-1-phosphate transferase
MAEDVSTGGLVRFRYEKESESKLSDERRKEIREAYARADERKRREKRNRIIFWIIGLVILLVVLLLALYRAF